jgi:hypothetical protein
MRFHKLRIAWSVFWGLACVLLIALWVRSPKACDLISKRDASGMTTTFCSSAGKVWFYRSVPPKPKIARATVPTPHGWKYTRIEVEGNAEPQPFVFHLGAGKQKIQFPDSVLVMACTIVGAAPWIRRFSLRTLLIAITLVAVGLGIIVWSMHQ